MRPHQADLPSFKNTGFAEVTVIVILAHFSDKDFGNTFNSVKRNLLHEDGKLGFSSRYFTNASEGGFQLKFKVVEKFVDVGKDLVHFTSQTRDHFYKTKIEFANMAAEEAKADIENIAQQYPLGQNSQPYSLLIIHPAEDNQGEDGLNSLMHETSFNSTVYPWALCSIKSLQGTFCHELGHSLFNLSLIHI